MKRPDLQERVAKAAAAALAERSVVSSVDVLVGLGWLPPSRLAEWRQGRLEYLEQAINANLEKISAAMRSFHSWARHRGLRPSETVYVARTRDRRRLRFSKSGNPAIELAYRTHWVSPELSAAKRERLAERQSRPPELVVVVPLHEWSCAACGGTGHFLLMEDRGPICMRCAGLDNLFFLAAGDAALTRRATKASRQSAVVVRFSRARKRYERQGVLVEEAALAAAELECLGEEEAAVRRELRTISAGGTADDQGPGSSPTALQRKP
jgi:hypothetical protein